MKIRTRLTLQFVLIGAVIVILSSLSIYFASASFRKADFYSRLRSNSLIAARLMFEADDIDKTRVEKMEVDNPVKLHDEATIIINFRDDTLYNSDKKKLIDFDYTLIERTRLHENINFRKGIYALTSTLYTSRFDRFVVLAAATDTDGIYFLRRLRLILVMACLGSIIVFFAAGWIYAGKALKPMSDMVARAEEISISSLNLRLDEGKGSDEISKLAATFNKMLGRLEKGFYVQKDFIANASHELRTPLTAINGQLEVLMMKDRSGDEYKNALGSILDDIRSLITLTNKLLLMARTSSESDGNTFSEVRIDEVLWQAQDDIHRFNKNARVNISLHESLTDADQMVVRGDESLLRVAVANISENGCKYSPDNSVDISVSQSGGLITLTFSDKGIGIPPEEADKVLQPFYRGSNSTGIQGTGIGLALVRQIIDKHKGKINIESAPGSGTKVILTLPLSVKA